jgi:signal transduction histidine kinase/DNA-binding response OmpR family regulator
MSHQLPEDQTDAPANDPEPRNAPNGPQALEDVPAIQNSGKPDSDDTSRPSNAPTVEDGHPTAVLYRVVSLLSASGIRSLPEVLRLLGEISGADRVYYARAVPHPHSAGWSGTAQWIRAEKKESFDHQHLIHIPLSHFKHWLALVRERGWAGGPTRSAAAEEKAFLERQGIGRCLIFAVPTSASIPDILVFDWLTEPEEDTPGPDVVPLQIASSLLSSAVSQANLRKKLRISLKQQDTLLQLSHQIDRIDEIDELYRLIPTFVNEQAFDRVALLVFENSPSEGLDRIQAPIDWRRSSHAKPFTWFVQAEPELCARLFSTAIPQFHGDINDSGTDPHLQALISGLNHRSISVLPLSTGERSTGALLLFDTQPHPFSDAAIRSLLFLAAQLSGAIRRLTTSASSHWQRFFDKLRPQLVVEPVAEDPVHLVKQITAELVRDVRIDQALVYLTEGEIGRAYLQAPGGRNPHFSDPAPERIRPDTPGLARRVLSTRTGEVASGPKDFEKIGEKPFSPEIQSEACLPLQVGGSLTGLLHLSSTKTGAFSPKDTAVFQAYANHLAALLEVARLKKQAAASGQSRADADQAQARFIANISHEFRSPLHSIIGFTRVLLTGSEGRLNITQKEDLNAIRQSAEHLISLVENSMDYARLLAGRMDLTLENVQVEEIIREAVSVAIGLIKGKPVWIEHSIPNDLPLVQADGNRVRQILLNLLSNAAEFTDEGTIHVEAVESQNKDGQPEILITVSDTGHGIRLEDQSRLFTPFTRLGDTAHQPGGTGLGLSIAQALVELHGGRIGLLKSHPGRGSTFYFTLPVVPVTALAITAPLPIPISGKGERPVILVFDDDSQVARRYQNYLEPYGFQTLLATDVNRAVEEIHQVKPYCILLDLFMPEKDGWQVLNDIKSDPVSSSIPVIVCSVLEEGEEVRQMGAFDYLSKPVLKEELVNAVQRLRNKRETCTILVIDDNPNDTRLVQKILADQKRYRVETAHGGQAGWVMIHAVHPDVILLDLIMPDVNGFDLLKRIQDNPIFCDTPVILLTGADLTAQQHADLKDYGQRMLPKALMRPKDLREMIDTVLNLKSQAEKPELS